MIILVSIEQSVYSREVGSVASGLNRRRETSTVLHLSPLPTKETLLADMLVPGISSGYEGPAMSAGSSVSAVNTPQF